MKTQVETASTQIGDKPAEKSVSRGMLAIGGIKDFIYLITVLASASVFMFTLGKTYTSVTESYVTKDELSKRLEQTLSDIESRVMTNEENIVEIQKGVKTLLIQGKAEADYISAQSIYQKYLKDWEDQLNDWSLDRASGSRQPRPIKRAELIQAEYDLEKAKRNLMAVVQ